MIRRILIANRGEIALRCIRACREMNIQSIAIYSDSDRDSLHVRQADEAVPIGGTYSRESYLDMDKIIRAAKKTYAQAIHPGYGYLSENAAFAEACSAANILFIGPSPSVISRMGNKSMARKIMRDAGVPVIPGSLKDIKSVRQAAAIAGEIGYPVIVKATAGGGGKGMRIVKKPENLKSAFESAMMEAESSFGSKKLYIEKFIDDARHIEIQVFGDNRGNVIHLGERECSIQRRHQKLIEESPSPGIDASMRELMGNVAVRAARAVGYEGAGTVEFVVQGQSFYFMEMNTRIQVEHPVTEMVTGVDLVKEQILVTGGERLSHNQEDISVQGHAIECRINAEDADNNFMPSPGLVSEYLPPGGPGVRVDSHLYSGYAIPHYFDSMISKLIAHAGTRNTCIERMLRALEEYRIGGIETTIPFHRRIIDSDGFREGNYSTRYIEHLLAPLDTLKTGVQYAASILPPPFGGAHGCYEED